MNAPQKILLGSLRVYRTLVSPLLGAIFGPMGFGCRYQPTCSCYAAEAVATHGALKGCLLALRRLGRCHPWGGSGYDPVPKRETPNSNNHQATLRPPRTAFNQIISPVKSA